MTVLFQNTGVASGDAYNLYNASLNQGGNAFKTPNDGNSYTLDSVVFSGKKVGSPNSTLTMYLYAHTGTFGSGVATGAALTSSDTQNASTWSTSTANITFTFSSGYVLLPNTAYVWALDNPGGDASNYPDVQYAGDAASATKGDGVYSFDHGSSWTAWTSTLAPMTVNGTIAAAGPANVKTKDGVTQSTGIKTYMGVVIASVKSVEGVT